MKHTTLIDSDIMVLNNRILDLDRIVTEVKQSEKWEVVQTGILETGLERRIQRGSGQTLVKNVESAVKKYEDTKSQLALLDK